MLFENSRYINSTTFRNSDNTVVYQSRSKKVYTEADCTIYLFKNGDRLDNLAYSYYGDSSYKWAILDCNPTYLCELDIKIGDYILIPSYKEVMSNG